MKYLAVFFLATCAVSSFPFDSRDCFEHSEMDCMGNFVDAVFYSSRGVDECSELGKFVDCSADSVDECFGDERDHEIEKGLEELENLFKDTCGAVSSGDNSDFDEEIYSHIQLTATIKKKKKASHSTTDKKTSVSSDSKKCFDKRKKICWDTFENAVIHSVFYSSTGLDKCSVLQQFVLCTRKSADDCFENEHDEDADEVLEVWENKSKEFCELDISDDTSVPNNNRPIDEDLKCDVTEWSQWSPCSVTCGNGHKVRTRSFQSIKSPMHLDECKARTWMEEETLCYTECSIILKEAETESYHSNDSEECFEEKVKICKNNVFNDIFYGFFLRHNVINKCSQIQIVLECARRAAGDCFKDRHAEEVTEVLEEYENQTKRVCETESLGLVPITEFLMEMLSTNYQKRETCVDENKDFIFSCVRRTMYIQDAGTCTMWKFLVRCMKARIDEKCGEETTQRFEDQLPDMSEEIKNVCEASSHTTFLD